MIDTKDEGFKEFMMKFIPEDKMVDAIDNLKLYDKDVELPDPIVIDNREEIEALDKLWKDRYHKAFFEQPVAGVTETKPEPEPEPEKVRFVDLFKEEE